MANPVIEYKLTGADQLQKTLQGLPKKVADRALRSALTAGALLVRNAMVDNAPRYAGPDKSIPVGWLASHFGTRVRILKADVAASIFIGPEGKIDYPDRNIGGGFKEVADKHGKKVSIGRISVASVARFLEFGTKHEAKNPFMSRAWESVKSKVLETIMAALKAAVEKAG